jgi:dTMP kinase
MPAFYNTVMKPASGQRPPFIAFDGIDGTGKSTQLALIRDDLQLHQLKVVCCVDPGGTPLGQQLRRLLLDKDSQIAMTTEALLFVASRAQLIAQTITPALQSGHIVLTDRFTAATYAYQGYAGTIPLETLQTLNAFATGGCEPGLQLIYDLEIETAMQRRGRPADRMEERDLDYHRRVRAGFLAEIARHPATHKRINAGPTVAEVYQETQKHVLEFLREIAFPGVERCLA